MGSPLGVKCLRLTVQGDCETVFRNGGAQRPMPGHMAGRPSQHRCKYSEVPRCGAMRLETPVTACYKTYKSRIWMFGRRCFLRTSESLAVLWSCVCIVGTDKECTFYWTAKHQLMGWMQARQPDVRLGTWSMWINKGTIRVLHNQ